MGACPPDKRGKRYRFSMRAALLSFLSLVALACDQGSLDSATNSPDRAQQRGASGASGIAPAVGGETPSLASTHVVFEDATEESGLAFHHTSGRSKDFFYAEFMIAGVLLFDAEGDGDPDALFTNGRLLNAPDDYVPPTNALFVNDGSGHFADDGACSGLDDPRYSVGVCGADYDNDGDVDVYVTNFDHDNALFRNEGELRFKDVAREAGVLGVRGFDTSCAFSDLDQDGWVELYVANCLDHTLEHNLICEWVRRDGQGHARRYCNPSDYEPLPDTLYKNRGDGTFEDVSRASGISAARGRSLGVAIADYDDDGDPDVFIACDRTSNLYYENLGQLRFRETALTTGAALSEEGKAQAGMGIAAGDFDGDGRIDVAVTYFEREWNAFYRNLGGNLFADRTKALGAARASHRNLSWGIDFFDADLDADLDVLIVNGHVIDNVHLFREPIAGYEQPNTLFLNQGERLEQVDAGPGFALEHVSRGLALADIDNDGDLDAIVANLNQPAEVLRNDTPRQARHWLGVRTVGTHSNRDGIGARIIAHVAGKKLVREVRSGQSYLSQGELRVHFGLGTSDVVPLLEVRWPSGRTTRLENVAADCYIEVVEPR